MKIAKQMPMCTVPQQFITYTQVSKQVGKCLVFSPEAFSDQVPNSKVYESAGAALSDTFSKGLGHCWSDRVAYSATTVGLWKPMKLKFSVPFRRLDITESRFVVRLRRLLQQSALACMVAIKPGEYGSACSQIAQLRTTYMQIYSDSYLLVIMSALQLRF